jgi:deoxyribonuclease-4
MRIGGHVSTEGGCAKAFDYAQAIGANTIQIFGASPVRWNAPLPKDEDAVLFRSRMEELDIRPVFLHAPYLINLCSPKDNMPALSRALLQRHLEISNALGAEGVIFHIGSRGTRPEAEAEQIVAESLASILNQVGEGTLLIENSAGAGNLVGDSLEEIARIIGAVENSRLNVCIDTAHAFAAGMIPSFSREEISKFLAQFRERIGLGRLRAVHLNDSKTEAFSNKDRHENIGEGYIGRKGFEAFFSFAELADIPMLLEVPGFDGKGPDRRNIEIVRSLAS